MFLTYSLTHELHLAAAHCGYTMTEFNALPGIDAFLSEDDPESKSMVLARYRADILLEAIKNDMVAIEQDRRIKQARRKR